MAALRVDDSATVPVTVAVDPDGTIRRIQVRPDWVTGCMPEDIVEALPAVGA